MLRLLGQMGVRTRRWEGDLSPRSRLAHMLTIADLSDVSACFRVLPRPRPVVKIQVIF